MIALLLQSTKIKLCEIHRRGFPPVVRGPL